MAQIGSAPFTRPSRIPRLRKDYKPAENPGQTVANTARHPSKDDPDPLPVEDTMEDLLNPEIKDGVKTALKKCYYYFRRNEVF